MNIIEELVKELRDENLLDEIEYVPFGQKRDSRIFQFNQQEKTTFKDTEFQGITKTEFSATTPILKEQSPKLEMRYSIHSIEVTELPSVSQSRVRLSKKTPKFTRTCKCCSSNVFIFDAYCTNCNERMIGNFLYYLFFIVSGIMIGFMIFFMATSNPY